MSVRLAWIGCGRHATEMLLPSLMRHGAAIEALCDVDAGALEAAARRFGVRTTYDDHRECVRHRGLEAIGMAVGPEAHPTIACAALERGLAVFIEKPPAPDAAGARRILDAARRAGRPALVGFMKRYSTGNRIARNLVAGGEFGDPLGFLASYTTAPTYFEGHVDHTGFFLHHCVHYMDLAPWLMGSPIADLSARKVEPEPGKLLFHLGLGFESGAVGTIVMGTVQSRGNPVEAVQIMGDHRRIEVTNVVDVVYHRDPALKADDLGATLADGADSLTWTPNFTVAANEDHKGYHALLGEVLAAMRGDASGAPTIAAGVTAMANLEAMVAALQHD